MYIYAVLVISDILDIFNIYTVVSVIVPVLYFVHLVSAPVLHLIIISIVLGYLLCMDSLSILWFMFGEYHGWDYFIIDVYVND